MVERVVIKTVFPVLLIVSGDHSDDESEATWEPLICWRGLGSGCGSPVAEIS